MAEPESHSVTSLQSHCQSCNACCCKNKLVVLSEAEHARIIQGNHTDYTHPVYVPEGKFYVLNYTLGACPYLGDNNFCTIEKDKPDTCRAYPMTFQVNRIGEFKQIGVSKVTKESCPAAEFLTDAFKEESIALLEKMLAHSPLHTKDKVAEAFFRNMRYSHLKERRINAAAHHNDQ